MDTHPIGKMVLPGLYTLITIHRHLFYQPFTLALTLSLSYLPFLADLLGLPWVLEEQEVVIFILLQMCLHAFQEHKWVFCNFLWLCLDSQINMFCHHNEITLWINDSICMAFVGSNFNISEHYTIPCVFNIQTVCSLASAVVETNVCLSTSHNLLHLFHWSLGETCQIQSNKIHFYFYYPFMLVFIFHS